MTQDTFEDIEHGKNEQWLDVTVRVTEILEADNPKASQRGILEDAHGNELHFISWENSNQPNVYEGAEYNIESLFIVYSKEDDYHSCVFRSKTQISEGNLSPTPTASTQASSSESEDEQCPYCSAPLSEEDYNEDPFAPTVGFEYFKCPDCNEKFQPEKAV